MADDVKDGGPAFPDRDMYGMSLRDWFAGQAVAGIATSCGFQGGPFAAIAKDAYSIADAMLAARSGGENTRATGDGHE